MSLKNITDTITSHGLLPNKKLGQHFLFDTGIIDRIVNIVSGLDQKIILEIGPGPGGLTSSLLQHGAKKVIAIEVDPRCIKVLTPLVELFPNRLEILNTDAIIFREEDYSNDKMTIVSNLPYNIGTLLLLKWLDKINLFDEIVVMLQKEVISRICAKPGTHHYGRLSVICQWLCDVEHIFDVEPEYFIPPPKVASSIVRLKPRSKALFGCKQKTLEKVCEHAFGMRRKMLKSSLKRLMPDAENVLLSLYINPQFRAEQLTIEEFCKIASYIDSIA